jgi:hypothetical protein
MYSCDYCVHTSHSFPYSYAIFITFNKFQFKKFEWKILPILYLKNVMILITNPVFSCNFGSSRSGFVMQQQVK